MSDDNPLSKHYGGLPFQRMSREEAATATFDHRFNSIARYVVRQASKFFFSLSREGRISYDVDDIFTEVWIELRQKDHLYDASIASYIAFATRLIRNHFAELRERSRCVRMPSNSNSTFRRFARKEEAGTLGPAQRGLLLQIVAAARDHLPMLTPGRESDEFIDDADGPRQTMEREEAEDERFHRLSRQLSTLTTLECVALGASLGLFGNDALASHEVAFKYGTDAKLMRRTLRQARRKLGIRAHG